MVCSFNQHLKEVGHQKRLGVTLLERLRRTSLHDMLFTAAVPNLFGTRERFCERQFFQGLGRGGGFRRIQAHYVHCALYFCYYCTSSTSEHQALDPRGWGIPDLQHGFFFFLRREDFREGMLCALWTHLALTSLGQPEHENRSSQKTPRLVPHIWRKATCDSPPKCFHSMWFLLKASPSSPRNEAEKKLHSIPATRGARMEEGVPLLQRGLQSQESPGDTLQLSGLSACGLTSPHFLNPQKPVRRGRTCL